MLLPALVVSQSAPGLAEVLTHWRLDPLWPALLVAAGAVYLAAWRRAGSHGRHAARWAWKRRLFFAGLVVLGLGVLSPIAWYGDQLLLVNFLGFLLVTMVAPPLILLGSPLTLAFKASGGHRRRQLRRLYQSHFASALTFPVVSWLLFAVITYLWQLTNLTDIAARHATVRDTQLITCAAAGLLFWLPVAGGDPTRWHMPPPLRGLYVLVEMTHKSLFGAFFLALNHPLHSWFADHVPSWGPSPMLDQRMALVILWVGGNVVFLFALAVIVGQWVAYEARTSARVDSRLQREREAEARRRNALDEVFRRPI